MKAVTEKLSAARDYIGLCWLAFVLSSTKMPIANCERCRMEHTTPAQMEACECLTCHGFYAGTLDLARVEEMLRLHPNGLLAKRTGAVSGTAVVDVDAPHGIPTMRQLIADGLLPRTAVQRTGSDGYHLVYKHPGAGMRIMSGAGKGGTGVDIKADDAYVVVAPSVHPRTRQRYQWVGPFSSELTPLPEYWVERLREPERPCPDQSASPSVRHGKPLCARRPAAPAGAAPGRFRGNAERHAQQERIRSRPVRRRRDARREEHGSRAGRRRPVHRPGTWRGAPERHVRAACRSAVPAGQAAMTDKQAETKRPAAGEGRAPP